MLTIQNLLNRFELSRAGTNQNIRAMEGLRGLAILLVFLAHYITHFEPYSKAMINLQSILNLVNRYGAVGVDLFFILSGYLIYGTLISKPINYFDFMRRRVRRLFPTFTFIFVLYLLLSVLSPAQSKIPKEASSAAWYLIANYLMLPPILPIKNMIVVAWSLSYEMFFYLTTPLWVIALRLKNWRPYDRIILYACASVLLLSFCSFYDGHVRMVMFLAGMILFETKFLLGNRGPNASVGLVALFASVLCLIPSDRTLVGTALTSAILYVSFFLVVLTCLQSSGGWFTALFCYRPLRLLGNMSYSFYLLHGVFLAAAIKVIVLVFKPDGSSPVFFFFTLFITLLGAVFVSAALFLLVEKPFSLVQLGEKKT
jgi:exopolysaccharide production protein ExoZ